MVSPRSVIDIGCGRGHWLVEFSNLGITDIRGVDSAAVLENSTLVIPAENFCEHDLQLPLQAARKFDLAMCLEVAEHLPTRSALQLLDTLVACADVVVFSAAIPGQGGVGHINERWPWYWRDAMDLRGYVQYDPFRHQLWHNPDIALYYRQNLFLYVKKTERPEIHSKMSDFTGSGLTLIATDQLYRMSTKQFIQRAARKWKDLIHD
jgi:hypothetical protein